MNNQQHNMYSNQQQHPDQWNQLLQWQQWQQQFHQSSYQQPFMPHQPFDHLNQFAVPPPPPPENDQPSTSSSMQQQQPQQHTGARNFNPNNNNNNFNQNNTNNRGQNNNRRGNQRNRGGNNNRTNTADSGNNQFNNFQNQKSFQQNSGNKDNNFQANNSNESNVQRQGNNNAGNRGRNQRNNWKKNRKNSGGHQQESSNENLSYANSAQSTSYQNPALQSNSAPLGAEGEFQTPEDIAFEEEFRKWEIQFEEWKMNNRNHPDKRQYQLYEKQFMDVREKLLTRREEMRRKKLQTISNPVKTAEQLAFESHWNSTPKIQNENSNNLPPLPLEPTPLPSTSQLPPSETLQPNATLSAAAILFGSQTSTRKNESFEKDYDIEDFPSFDDKNVNRLVTFDDTRNFTIPGLEIPVENVQDKVTNEENSEVIDLDRDEETEIPEEYNQGSLNENVVNKSNIDKSSKKENNPLSNIPIPRFRPRVQRTIININDLLYEPKRSTRPEKIMILIRGAPGSGKHFIANLIYEKEKETNERCAILSIDKYVIGNYDSIQTENYNQALYSECRNLVREGYINFAIVILNGCTIQQFNKFSHTAQSLGHYNCYSIEIHQTRDMCEANNINNRSQADIINAIEDLDRYPTPAKIPVVDPTSLLKFNDPSINSNLQPSALSNTDSSDPSNVNDFAQKMAKILQDKKVIEILQAQLKNVSQPPVQAQSTSIPPQNLNMPVSNQFRQLPRFSTNDDQSRFYQSQPIERNLDDIPVFKPNKVIDYDHEHIPTFEEKLMEFKIFRVIEYNHKETPTMREYLKDIDLDKILEKRKAVALRKKILEYLRSAERPEDTVSNPKYPKNWEVIQHERPPRKNKRRKIMTTKIKRILLQKSREENSWMTKGYNDMPRDDAMDLEEISSEDDETIDIDVSPKTQKVDKTIENIPICEYVDEFRDVYKTTPDFNHFNHPNAIDIRKLLMPPDRNKRPNRILIILRGASGSGKSHLVQLIKRKETEMGNEASNIRILSIEDYFEDDEELSSESLQEITKNYLEEMQKHLRKTINEGLYNFVMIDAENCDLISYNQFHQIGSSMNFAVYTIELYQTFEICIKQCKHLHSPDNIKNSIDLFSQNPTPKDHILLIPSALYAQYNCFVNPKISNKTTSIVTYKKYLEQTIDEEKLLSSMPNFNWHNRQIMNIAEILEDPGRFQRNEFIAILMRGPNGSGKEALATAIIEKEKQYDVEDVKFISIAEDKSVVNKSMQRFEFVGSRNDKLERLIKILRDIMRVKAHKFLIIDSETGDFENYKRLHDLVSSYQYQCYTIELYQDASICQQNEKGESKIEEIENVLEEMQLNPTPDDHILLNASIFYKQTVNSSDRPLKSALKISPNTKHLSETFNRIFSKLNMQSKYEAIFNQRVKINGEFIKRNEKSPSKLPEFNWFNQDITDIKEIIDKANQSTRPKKIVIFLRGAQSSGKTYLARLIERREFENDNKNVEILSVDEFFEIEQYQEVENKCEKFIEVNLDSSKLNEYMEQLSEKFNAQITNGEFSFIIVDGDFCDLKYYNQMYNAAKQKNYTCYTIELNQDEDICIKYNDHKWNESIIRENNKRMQEIQIPNNHLLLDPESLYHDYTYVFNPNGNVISTDEKMDTSDVSDNEDILNDDDYEDDDTFETKFGKFKMSTVASKWDDVETPDINRLDGTMKKSERVTMKDYLQSDEWSMRPSSSGKKRVRWADIEEKKEQERMRSIGFIVGMTDWNRMTDESDGRNALEKTKYIEPRKKN